MRKLAKAAVTSGAVLSAAALVGAMGIPSSTAALIAGTPGNDVHVGLDTDVASNPFIQPPGNPAKHHMDATDVVFGRAGHDLLIGRQGSDTIPAGTGNDILVGGPEAGSSLPNSDVLLGEEGNDINVWAPGDGSDAYVGDKGYDTMVFAPFVLKPNGSIKTEWKHGRTVPRVDISGKPQFSCTIVKVPANKQLGQFLVRFNVNGNAVVTVRQKDVERLLCPSATPGYVKVADLTRANPHFVTLRLSWIGGTLGDVVKRP